MSAAKMLWLSAIAFTFAAAFGFYEWVGTPSLPRALASSGNVFMALFAVIEVQREKDDVRRRNVAAMFAWLGASAFLGSTLLGK